MGGPDPLRNVSGSHLREIDIINHSLQFQGGDYDQHTNVSFVSGAWDTSTNAVELRFKALSRTEHKSMSLFDVRKAGSSTMQQMAWIEPSASSVYGWVNYAFKSTDNTTWHSSSMGKLPILDNDWWNLLVRKADTTNKIYVRCQKSPDHAESKITHESQSVITAPNGNFYGWENASSTEFNLGRAAIIPSASTNARPGFFSGSMQEARIWDSELDDFAFDLHTKAPTCFVGNHYTSSYENLIVRLALGTDNVIPDTGSYVITSSHTNQSTSKYFDLSGSFEWEEQEEVYYITTMNSLGMRPVANKIRIEQNSIPGVLDPFEKHEASSHDTNPIDLPDLYVSISPQDDLDIDIGLQYGQVQIDDFIGDPRERWYPEYKDLRGFREYYFQKYSGPQQIQAFIRLIKYFNSALFKQIESMLPARGTNVVGLMIKPTMLERPKISAEPSFSFQEVQLLGKTGWPQQNLEHYTQSIDCYPFETMLANSDDYDAMEYVFTHDGTYARQWFSTLTDTVPLPSRNPNIYSHSTCTINYNTGVFNDTAWVRQGVMTFVSKSVLAPAHWLTEYYYNSDYSASIHKWHSSSFYKADLQTYEPLPERTRKYTGCRMTGDDFNIPSEQTIDGGPVVSFIEGNPNTLFSVEPSFLGDLDVR